MLLPMVRPPAGFRRLLLPIAALVLLTACDSTFGAPEGATEQGREISSLYRFLFWMAIGVGATVYGLILWSVFRYRRRSDDLPPQFRENIPLEILYTVIPIALVVVIAVATFRTEDRVDTLDPDPDVTVVVTGFQWQWRFEYPEHGIDVVGSPEQAPTVVVPADRTIRVELRATDVIHSFYVPEFLFKRDAIPGEENSFDLVVPEAGTYYGECAEYCGLDHVDMVFWIRAVPQSDFDRWVAEQQGAG